MKYVIDLDRLSNGIDYWRNPGYKPQKFGAKNNFFNMLKNMQEEGNFVSAYSKEAEQNLPEIVRWFELNGIKNIPIVFTKDDDMVEVWDDRAMHVDPDTGEFIISQKLADDQIKKTTYAPVKVEVTTVEPTSCYGRPEGFADWKDLPTLTDKIVGQLDGRAKGGVDEIIVALKEFQNLRTDGMKDKDLKKLNDKSTYLRRKLEEIKQEVIDNKEMRRGLKLIEDKIIITDYPSALTKKVDKLLEAISTLKNKKGKLLLVTDADAFNQIKREFLTVIQPFKKMDKSARRQLARLNKELVKLTDKKLRKPLEDMIAKIEEARKKGYKGIDEVDIEEWASLKSPIGTTLARKEAERAFAKRTLAKRVSEFEALDPDEQFVRIVANAIEKDVAREINSTQVASDYLEGKLKGMKEKPYKRPYQRDYFRRVTTAAGLQMAKDAVKKVDEILVEAKLAGKVKEDMHKILFNQFIKSGEVAVRATVKKLSGLPDKQKIREQVRAKTPELSSKSDRAKKEEESTKILDKAFEMIQKKVAQISKLSETIESATPEELDFATKALGEKQALLRTLKASVKRLGNDPGSNQTVVYRKNQIRKLLGTGLTKLERAIFTKRRRDKELKKKKKELSTNKLGRKVASKIKQETFNKEHGILTKKERVELVNSEYGIDGPIAEEIASLYAPEQIMAAKPFRDKPAYVEASIMPEEELMAKLKARGALDNTEGKTEQKVAPKTNAPALDVVKNKEELEQVTDVTAPILATPAPAPPDGSAVGKKTTTGKPDELKFQPELEGTIPEPELKGVPLKKQRTPEEQKENDARVKRYKDRVAAGGLSPENKLRRKQIIGLGGRFDPSASDEQYVQQIENLKKINRIEAIANEGITATKGTEAYDLQKRVLDDSAKIMAAIKEQEYKDAPWMRPGNAGKSTFAQKEEADAKRSKEQRFIEKSKIASQKNKRQDLISKINVSKLLPAEKQRLIQVVQADKDIELRTAYAEVQRALSA